MTDEERRAQANQMELDRRLEKVTPELFAQFFSEKNIDSTKCTYCGSDDVGSPQRQVISTEGNGWHMDYVRLDTRNAPFSFINFEYRIICRNCGFTSYFSVWPVLQWIEGRQK